MLGTMLALAVWSGGIVPPLPPRAENTIRFESRDVELRRNGERWQLWHAGKLIKDLGTNDAEAREVVSIIRQLRLTQRGVIGSRAPVMEYWLSDGTAPTGLVAGHRLARLDRDSLKVEEIQGNWCLRDNVQLWFNFGPHAEDARQALEVIRKYDFTRIGYVGQLQTAMVYFMCGHDTPTPKGANFAAPLVISQHQLWQVRQLTAPSPFSLDPKTGEERVTFDWRKVELSRDGQRWKLVHNGQTLADFGYDELAARDGLRVVQFYRFTEQCRVGRAADYLTYFLVNGQAPQGARLGVRGQGFDPERLAVKQLESGWAVCQGERIVAGGAASETEARQALNVIQKYRFDFRCQVGNEGAGFSFLVKER